MRPDRFAPAWPVTCPKAVQWLPDRAELTCPRSGSAALHFERLLELIAKQIFGVAILAPPLVLDLESPPNDDGPAPDAQSPDADTPDAAGPIAALTPAREQPVASAAPNGWLATWQRT